MRHLILITALLAALPAAARDWRVPVDALTVSAAMDSAQAGDSVVLVCASYSEHSIVLKNGVTLRSDTGWADCATIDADWGGPVLIADGVDATARVEGVRLFRGLSDFGGGVKCSGGSPTFVRCTFEGNRCYSGGGAAQLTNGAAPTFDACLFVNNTIDQGNGGAVAAYSCSPTLTACEFTENSASGDAGAVYLSNGTADVTDCTFLRNTAGNYGGALRVDTCDGEVQGCLFDANTAGNGGGAVLAEWGPVRFRNCTFTGNDAGTLRGGGLMTSGYDVIGLHDCVFEGNNAPTGGAIHGGCDLLLVDCRIEENTAESSAGGISLAGGLHMEGLRTSIRLNSGGYPADCFIPENSTASLHCCEVDLAHWYIAASVWIDLVNCTVGDRAATWGEVKSLYR